MLTQIPFCSLCDCTDAINKSMFTSYVPSHLYYKEYVLSVFVLVLGFFTNHGWTGCGSIKDGS